MKSIETLATTAGAGSAAASILIVSADFPNPVDTGKKVVLNGMLSYFLDRFGRDNVTWMLVGADHEAAGRIAGGTGVRMAGIPLPHTARRLASLVWYSLLRRSKSLQESLFYSPQTRERIERELDERSPDLVVFDTIRTGQFLPSRFRDRAILYLDDLFSIRYGRMLDQLEEGRSFGSTVLGNFARFIPTPVCRQINRSKGIQSLLLRCERRLVAQSERGQAGTFPKSILLNAEEVESLQRDAASANVLFMPPFLEAKGGAQRSYDGNGTFIYLGALNYPPNEAGLLEFFDKGLAGAMEKIPGFELVIVGRGASGRLVEAVGRCGGRVRLAGFVEDLAPLFATCCALILPIVLGTGVKLKALEAMSRGVPIVSTRMGVDSIPVRHGVEVFVEDDLSSFWVWMERLTGKEANQRMSAAAFERYQAYYSREAVYRVYDSIFLTPAAP